MYGKKQLSIPNERVLRNSNLQKIFFINNGRTINIESISHTNFKNMINSAHRYLKEFSEYEYLSSWTCTVNILVIDKIVISMPLVCFMN